MKKHLVTYLVIMFVLLVSYACSNSVNYHLDLQIEGKGQVTPQSADFPRDSIIVFDIQAEEGWFFHGWSGESSFELKLVQDKWNLLMTSHKKLIAVFKENSPNPEEPSMYDLNITIIGQGNISPNSGSFPAGEEVTITVVPQGDWNFNRWQGLHGSDVETIEEYESYSIKMDGNKSLTAIFKNELYYVIPYTTGQGSVKLEPEKQYYGYGEIVTFTAKPEPGWCFSHWIGPVYDINNPISFRVNDDTFIRAIFVESNNLEFTLKTEVLGFGYITIKPDQDTYNYGDRVTLTADAEPGYKFVGWTGSISNTSSQIHFDMDDNKAIFANFEKITNYYTLKVASKGEGSVTIEPDNTLYEEGSLVTLTAQTTKDNWSFVNWTGDIQSTSNIIQVLMDDDKEIIANFQQPTHRLTAIIKEGRGYIEVTSDNPDYDPEDYYEHFIDYPIGTKVTLSANPSSCWGVDFWEVNGEYFEGELEIGRPIKVTMDENKTVYLYIEYVG